MQLELKEVTKGFGKKKLFTDISAWVSPGAPLVISGPNGSGKSTLAKIIAGLVRPDRGSLHLILKGEVLAKAQAMALTGLVSPELGLYDTLTAREHLEFYGKLRGINLESIPEMLEKCQLKDYPGIPAGKYSSGMRQRLKLASSLLHRPVLLILDEPTANLDEAGRNLVYQLINDYQRERLVVLATNEPEEVERFGKNRILLAT